MNPTEPTRQVLFVAYFFPPLGGGGVMRSLNFARYLPQMGWQPIILAAAQDAPYWAWDPSLVTQIPAQAQVHRVPENLLGRAQTQWRRLLPAPLRRLNDRALLPDRQITWLPGAWLVAQKLLKQHSFSCIYSTGAPWTDHLLGLLLARQTGLPWVADFRDPWTQNSTFQPLTRLHAQIHQTLESQVHQAAQISVANTAQNRRDLLSKFELAPDRVIHIPNGYAAEELAGLPPPDPRPGLRLTYAGSFYPGYGPQAFFQGLEKLAALAPRLDLELQFLGKTEGLPTRLAQNLPWPVLEPGYLPHRVMLEKLSASDICLLFLPPDAQPGWVPQKLYTYLALGRPILALCPPGEAKELILEAQPGALVLDPARPDPTLLAEWLKNLANSKQPMLPHPSILRFERRALTQTLADTFNRLATNPPIKR